MNKQYKVKLWWYSEVIVDAKNKEEAKELGKFHKDSGLTNLDSVDVEELK